jgi:hypothetical protein
MHGEILRFFARVQPARRPYRPAPSASVVTPIPSATAMQPYSGMGRRPLIATETLPDMPSMQKEWSYVPTGNDQTAVPASHTTRNTNVQDVENQIMELSAVLERTKLNAGSPYKPEVWRKLLVQADLIDEYPNLPSQLLLGFNAGIQPLSKTFTPPNKPSILKYLSEFRSIVEHEFKQKRYIGPLSRSSVETLIGPFQTSPLGIIPKPGKPGKFRLVQNLSYPYIPRSYISSINSSIDSDNYPSTWGTFTVICLLLIRLPPGSQLAIRDVKEAYRTIPLDPSQWPGVVVRLDEDDTFAIDTRNLFGLASSSGCYGVVADAGTQLMRKQGMGPISKWVDDHMFARIRCIYLEKVNEQRREAAARISANGGKLHDGGRLWFKGELMPNDHHEEFDEDCSAPILDLSTQSPRSIEDAKFTYAMADIDQLSDELGIPWEITKDIPFSTEAPFIGFLWNLETYTVAIPESKKTKYLNAIFLWEKERTHNLEEVQKLYGKLLHACQVVPAGRAYLTSLEKFMAIFGDSAFMPRVAPRSTASDLFWWKQTLQQPTISRCIPGPNLVVDSAAYSDASSEIGIGIVIGTRWRAWRLLPAWKAEQRDIGWAESVGFLFLVLTIVAECHQETHHRVYGDNQGVVEGWWKGRSRNIPTNEIFKLIHTENSKHGTTFYTRYVASKHNPADEPSRGIYGPTSHLLPPICIPHELRRLVVDFDAEPQAEELRREDRGHQQTPLPKPTTIPGYRERRELNDRLERRAEELFAQTQSW